MKRKLAAFDVFLYTFLIIVLLMCLLPFLHILSVSFSNRAFTAANKVYFWPRGLTLENFRVALGNADVIAPLTTSLLRMVIGVIINMFLVICAAYPLSKDEKQLPGKTFYTGIFIFVMMFNGGMIPGYLLCKQLNILDTIWALTLGKAVPIFCVILMLNFFRQLPKPLEEAAFIDGASYFTALVRVYIPLALPSIATVTMMQAIYHWNSWFDGLLFMRSPQNYPYATYLRMLLEALDSGGSMSNAMAQMMATTSARGMKMAYIVFAIIPIMFVFPMLQKQVKQGLTIGSVKE